MSEFHTVECIEINDEKCLVESLEIMGYQPEVHKIAKKLFGYQGDFRSQKAHVVIPRKQISSSSNDIGFEKQDKGYAMHISDFDQRQNYFSEDKFKKIYNEKKLTKELVSNRGFVLRSRKVENDGTVRLRLAKLY